MPRRRSVSSSLCVALVFTLTGCGSLALRPRSIECTAATLVSSVSCQPMERAPDNQDAEAKKFAPAVDQARLYVVRPSIVGGRYAWTIQVDGKSIGAVAEHTFLLLTLDPGRHEIAVVAGENRHALVVEAGAGEIRFVEVVSRLGWTQSKAEVRSAEHGAGEAAVLGSRRVDPF